METTKDMTSEEMAKAEKEKERLLQERKKYLDALERTRKNSVIPFLDSVEKDCRNEKNALSGEKMELDKIFSSVVTMEMHLMKARNIISGLSNIYYNGADNGIFRDERRFKDEKPEDKTAYKSPLYAFSANVLTKKEREEKENNNEKCINEYFYFRFPEVVNRRSNTPSKPENARDHFIKDFVHTASFGWRGKWQDEKECFFSAWSEYLIIFVHHYDGNVEKKMRTDTDNYDIKKPIDGLLGTLVQDDGAKNSHIIQLTKMTENGEPYTEMYVYKGHALSDLILRNLPSFQG